MQPLIKWPGGKTKEFPHIKELIPPFDRYIEPFFGGGAVFFQLDADNSIINDINQSLFNFYKLVKEQKKDSIFKSKMYSYVDNWEKISIYSDKYSNTLLNYYKSIKSDMFSDKELKEKINSIISNDLDFLQSTFSENYYLDSENLVGQLVENLTSKLLRTKNLENKYGSITEFDILKNIETAFRSGFYMHFRDLMNYDDLKYKLDLPTKISNYYFIREFCYGSMFRFNREGHFNIPYGGMAYNSKNFRLKVDYIFSDAVESKFRNTLILNADFEKIFEKFNFTNRDFIFIDPPYDTEFSDYDNNSFDKKDQERLAKCLYSTNAKFILLIKNTPFILSLYSDIPKFKITSFDKTYLYNVKGRNDRDVEHLVIYNF